MSATQRGIKSLTLPYFRLLRVVITFFILIIITYFQTKKKPFLKKNWLFWKKPTLIDYIVEFSNLNGLKFKSFDFQQILMTNYFGLYLVFYLLPLTPILPQQLMHY